MEERDLERALLDLWEASAIVQRSRSNHATTTLKRACAVMDFMLAESLAGISVDRDVNRKFTTQETQKTTLNLGIPNGERTD